MGLILNFNMSKTRRLAAFLGLIDSSNNLAAYSQILTATRLDEIFRLLFGYLYFIH